MSTGYEQTKGAEHNFGFLEFFKIIASNKLVIVLSMFITTSYAINYVLNLPDIYKAQVLMFSTESSSSKVSNRLGGRLSNIGDFIGISSNSLNKNNQKIFLFKTRNFLLDYINGESLKPILFPEQWNNKDKKWIKGEPSDAKSVGFLKSMIRAYADEKNKTGAIFLEIEWKNAKNTRYVSKIANGLVNFLNIREKDSVIKESKANIFYLKDELERTSIIDFQKSLYQMIELEMRKIMLANTRGKYYVFKVVDEAIRPISPEPKISYIILLMGLMSGMFIGIFLAVLKKYSKY
jgi:hypothetical protein